MHFILLFLKMLIYESLKSTYSFIIYLFWCKCVNKRLDKNPHPFAKQAFEALAAAYEKISDPLDRSVYDISREKMKKHQRSLSVLWSRSQDVVENVIARILLLVARCRRGEIRDEIASMKEWLASVVDPKRQAALDLYHKFKFAPTAMDKISLAGEIGWDQKYTLISFLVFLRLLILI
jgi:hypothetical protein